MPRDPEIGLVGRDQVVELVESLVERAPRPLPIVLAFGPGGGGKTALLDHLESRYGAAPLARVDLDTAGSASVRAILDVACDQLLAYSHPQFGRLKLPRYRLARAAVRRNPDSAVSARTLIGRELAVLPRLATVIGALLRAAPPGRWLGRVLEPFLHWLIVTAVVSPTGLRWLFGSVGTTLRWFEKVAGPEIVNVTGLRADDVVARAQSLAAQPAPEGHAEVLDRLLVRAFVADVRGAYRWRRHRRLATILLLDDTDLLPGAESREAADAGGRLDFLELLAEARLVVPDAPLLTVATKQARPSGEVGIPYDRWRTAFDHALACGVPDTAAYLPVELPSFGRGQTEQLLAQWNASRGRTVETQAVVDELQDVTHGHPLAVRALYRRNQTVGALRALYDEPLDWIGAGAHWDRTIGGFLLWRFLQRMASADPIGPDVDGVDRSVAARDYLARLAAPQELDVPTVRAVTGLGEFRAGQVLERLREFSFASVVGADPEGGSGSGPGFESGTESRPGLEADLRLRLHPLLRELLVDSLARLVEPGGESAYVRVHGTLREHFAARGRPVDQLYHALALGDVPFVAERAVVDGRLLDALPAIVAAPLPPAGVRQPIVRRLLDRVVRAAHTRHGRTEHLVEALWSLHSCTSVERRTTAAYAEVITALTEVSNHRDAPADRVSGFVEAYDRAKAQLRDRTPAQDPPRLPAESASGAQRPYPKVWPPRHTARRIVVGGVALFVLGYGAIYVDHEVRYCNTPGPLEVGTVVGEVTNSSLRLDRDPGGQCIGVTARPGLFVHDLEASPNAREVARLTALIGAENDAVLERSRRTDPTRRPYVTVVVATMLSSTAEMPQRDLSAGINELRGAYLAQHTWNRLNNHEYPPRRLIRLVFANFGGNSAEATRTAAQIRELAAADPTVVAVTGLGQTRTATLDAAETIGAPGAASLPMVGSVPSGDGFTGKTHFVRVGPNNEREAQVTVALARKHDLVDGRAISLVLDNSDEYSKDLGRVFEQALPGGAVALSYDAGGSRTSESLSERADQICADAERRHAKPTVFYLGRTTELPTFLSVLRASPCGEQAIVVGDDDLTQLETAGYADLTSQAYVDGRLYFSTFGPSKDGWERLLGGGPLPSSIDDFFRAYDAAQAAERSTPAADRAYRTGPNGHIMMAYDAVRLVGQALARLESTPGSGSKSGSKSGSGAGSGAVVGRDALWRALRDTVSGRPYAGPGGVVEFPKPQSAVPDEGADPLDKLVVLQRVVERNGHLVSRYVDADGALP